MGLLSRFKKQKEEPKEDKKVRKVSLKKPESRAASRVTFGSSAGVRFFLVDDGPEVEISNLSTSGVALAIREGSFQPKANEIFHGHFEVDDSQIEVQLKVVHVTNSIAGCVFESNLSAVRLMVVNHLPVELSAIKMSKVNSSMLRVEEGQEAHLFVGGEKNELHYFTENDDVTKFDLTFFGHRFSGSPEKSIIMEDIVDDPTWAGVRIKATPFVSRGAGDEEYQRKLAVRFLKNIKDLPEKHCAQIIEYLYQT